MKKLTALLLALAMIFSLAACSNTGDGKQAAVGQTPKGRSGAARPIRHPVLPALYPRVFGVQYLPRVPHPSDEFYVSIQHCRISRIKNSTARSMTSSRMRSLLPWIVERSSLVRSMAEKRYTRSDKSR